MKQINIKKILIIVIIAFGVSFVYYKLILQFQTEKIKELSELNKSYVEELQNVEKNQNYKEELEVKIRDLEQGIEESVKTYFPSVKQEKLILILDSLITTNNLICSDMKFSATIIEGLEEIMDTKEEEEFLLRNLKDEYTDLNRDDSDEQTSTEESSSNEKTNQNAMNNENSTQENIFSIENMSVSLELEGSYENISKFIESINKYTKKIVIRDVTINTSEIVETSTDRSGNIVETVVVIYNTSVNLDFYAIPKLKEDETDFEYNNWTLSNVYGKDNPFK